MRNLLLRVFFLAAITINAQTAGIPKDEKGNLIFDLDPKIKELQINPSTLYYADTTHKIEWYTTPGKTIFNLPTPICIEDLIAYKKECYNDSTKSTTIKYVSYKDGGYTKNYIWIHREPTLDGFIDYLLKHWK